MITYFTWDGFGEVNAMKNVNENVVKQGFCLNNLVACAVCYPRVVLAAAKFYAP